MLKALKQNIVFLSLSLMLIIALGLAILCIPKGELHLLLCDRHSPARDVFYSHITDLAATFPYIVCALILVFGRIGDGVFGFTAMFTSGLVTQFCKRIENTPRPLTWFAENMPDVQLPLTEGVDMNLWYSFPSGHATSFFALAFFLSIVTTKYLSAKQSNSVSGLTAKQSNSISGLTGVAGLLQIVLVLFAALGCYSRLYLSQHFAIDILVGIVIGIVVTGLIYLLFSCFEDKKWYNYHLFSKK